ncbi:quinoprotein dehydrogenase-associated SoxYZ-like carrier [Poseidonocella sedimentorum]|uniref:Sulfur-oxidizing protein SoxY n=1 Tax=Poseidonocella sedimentorum TaxID=871652 RepID=A0A1I6D3N0_9RHOB|nr:quinoprotein dehydrogenase-associated SoxYZ-like carrier [Poseidonocella sedimentorum]SFR00066.1 sulfur-oxidizing protein SoxY [Poseidonocella sedimentorum]
MKIVTLAGAALLCLATPLGAETEPSWTYIAHDLYGTRALQDGAHLISIDTPYRTQDDARTRVAAQVVAPEGLKLGKVSVILDENPMPVSAVFSLDVPQERLFFDVTLRFNGGTPLHVVAETTDGQLFVAETFVKTSGKGACAAPPGTDPIEAMATLGNMDLSLSPLTDGSAAGRLAALSARQRQLDVDISHPSHSGMQMDQISLLFIPMRYVETLEIDLDGAGYVDVTGSISLSENPALSLSVPAQTERADVTMIDTDGTRTTATTRRAGY